MPIQRRRLRTPTKIVPGASPGLASFDATALPTTLRATAFGPDGIVEHAIEDVGVLAALRRQHPVVWVDVIGLGTEGLIRDLAEEFALHRLTLEDVVNLGQRPKTEFYEGYVYTVARMAPQDVGGPYEQLSLLFGDGFVLTFQQHEGDPFEPVRERLRKTGSPIRGRGSDYLAYALLDAVVDGYFPHLQAVADAIAALEEECFGSPTPRTLQQIRRLRVDLLELRRTAMPHREAIGSLGRPDTPFVTDNTRLYLRDCLDHLAHVIDLIDAYRSLGEDLVNFYLSTLSNKMNEVMKVLTIIATIFIPLSFVAGVYGMNFDTSSRFNMPELSSPYGYPIVLGGMLAVGVALVAYFRRRGWL